MLYVNIYLLCLQPSWLLSRVTLVLTVYVTAQEVLSVATSAAFLSTPSLYFSLPKVSLPLNCCAVFVHMLDMHHVRHAYAVL